MRVQVAIAGMAMIAFGAGAEAQVRSTEWTFGGGLGLSVPLGDFRNFANDGWHAGGTAIYTPPQMPVGFRFDVTWHGLGDNVRDEIGVQVTRRIQEHWSTISATADVQWMIPMTPIGAAQPTSRPYLLGGVGLYNLRNRQECISPGCAGFGRTDSNTEFGVNLGGGMEFQLAGFSAFVEGRWHNIFSAIARPTDSPTVFRDEGSAHLIPISFGILFR